MSRESSLLSGCRTISVSGFMPLAIDHKEWDGTPHCWSSSFNVCDWRQHHRASHWRTCKYSTEQISAPMEPVHESVPTHAKLLIAHIYSQVPSEPSQCVTVRDRRGSNVVIRWNLCQVSATEECIMCKNVSGQSLSLEWMCGIERDAASARFPITGCYGIVHGILCQEVCSERWLGLEAYSSRWFS